jgi:tyrosyl-tRNA synthetase
MVKISQDIKKISKGEATPDTYKEFYDLWMNTYKETFSRMFDPQTMKPSKEMLDSLKESMDISLNLFKSWTAVLEKMAEKMHEQSKLMNDPEAFKEFYNLWIKMFEKSSEDIFEGIPLVSPLKEMLEPVKSACKIYAQTSIKMSRMWMDSFNRMAPAQKS